MQSCNNIFIDKIIGVDGTNKSEIDGFTREWPDDVNCSKNIIEDLRKRKLLELKDNEIEFFQIY